MKYLRSQSSIHTNAAIAAGSEARARISPHWWGSTLVRYVLGKPFVVALTTPMIRRPFLKCSFAAPTDAQQKSAHKFDLNQTRERRPFSILVYRATDLIHLVHHHECCHPYRWGQFPWPASNVASLRCDHMQRSGFRSRCWAYNQLQQWLWKAMMVNPMASLPIPTTHGPIISYSANVEKRFTLWSLNFLAITLSTNFHLYCSADLFSVSSAGCLFHLLSVQNRWGGKTN